MLKTAANGTQQPVLAVEWAVRYQSNSRRFKWRSIPSEVDPHQTLRAKKSGSGTAECIEDKITLSKK